MEAFWSVFLVVFLAEMGDKTQFLVMAFAAKYDWRRVFAGMVCGILVVHSLAVGSDVSWAISCRRISWP